jgi:leucyl-tRNA synthetase
VTIVLQINGRIRDEMEVPVDADRASVEAAAQGYGRIPELIAGRPVRRVIVVPGKLVNIVVAEA